MAIQNFKEIIAWQKSHELALMIYKVTEGFPKSELFGLISQLRRNAVSIPSNLVEGYKRKSKNDAVHFYVIAGGSLEEMKYQIILAKDLGYLTDMDYNKLQELAEEAGKLLYKWKINQK